MDEELIYLYMQMVNRQARTELLKETNNKEEQESPPKTESPFTKIQRLLNEGLSPRQIAKRTGVPRKAIKKMM